MILQSAIFRTVCRWLFFLSAGGVTVGSLLPQTHVSSVFVLKDWIVHAAAYAFCTVLAICGFEGLPSRIRAMIGLLMLGGVIEIVQPYVGRSFAWHDLLANLGGVVIAAATTWPFARCAES
ncbi:MAG: hypothetical protein KDB27_11315 [Planctomycetales bacterium]|nr:hypothetical protein [Planctomycetales bacterium]